MEEKIKALTLLLNEVEFELNWSASMARIWKLGHDPEVVAIIEREERAVELVKRALADPCGEGTAVTKTAVYRKNKMLSCGSGSMGGSATDWVLTAR